LLHASAPIELDDQSAGGRYDADVQSLARGIDRNDGDGSRQAAVQMIETKPPATTPDQRGRRMKPFGQLSRLLCGMRRGRSSTLGQCVAGILITLSSVSLAGCAALTINSGAESQGTAASATAPYPTSIEELRQRPLRPTGAGIITTCPTMPAHVDVKLVPASSLVPGKPPISGPFDGYGVGPVYLSGNFYPGAWDMAVWLVKPLYAGPLVIRGLDLNRTERAAFSRQLDGLARPIGPAPGAPVTTVSGFGESIPFYSELDLPAEGKPPYWRAYFADTHFGEAGCYMIQVDGSTFSETFRLEVPDAARQPG
jgi:hypothetical protein